MIGKTVFFDKPEFIRFDRSTRFFIAAFSTEASLINYP